MVLTLPLRGVLFGDKEENIKVSSGSNVRHGLFDVVKYRSLSQLLITFSTLPCVVFPLSRHVLIKTADYRRQSP